jgi:hypothetical protein
VVDCQNREGDAKAKSQANFDELEGEEEENVRIAGRRSIA